MIDDAPGARPQSGFNAASVVWQAPAEGGVPRYMMVFQEQMPTDVGPVRSARYYFITWAAEWTAVYGHVGGSPQAIATLRAKGNGQLVYNADQFRWGGTLLPADHAARRAAQRLLGRASRCGSWRPRSAPRTSSMKAVWRFAPGRAARGAAIGGIIRVAYPQNKIEYRYDRATQHLSPRRYRASRSRSTRPTGKRVAPKNVVIMMVSFGPLNDGSNKHRLEAKNVGSGQGLDRDERPDHRGHLEEDLARRADPVLRQGRQAGHPDRGPDVHPGHATWIQGHDQGRHRCQSRSRRRPRRRRRPPVVEPVDRRP